MSTRKQTDLFATILLLALLVPVGGSTAGQPVEHVVNSPQTTVTLTAVADATLKSWQPAINYGTDPTLQVSHSHIDTDENTTTLVPFDLSSLPPAATVLSATFQSNLAFPPLPPPTMTVEMKRVTTS